MGEDGRNLRNCTQTSRLVSGEEEKEGSRFRTDAGAHRCLDAIGNEQQDDIPQKVALKRTFFCVEPPANLHPLLENKTRPVTSYASACIQKNIEG